jgi:hypothetical protein
MKPLFTFCLLLAAVSPALSATIQSEKFRDKDQRFLSAQQAAPARPLVSGFLYAAPAAKRTPADTSTHPRPSAGALPQAGAAGLSLNGRSGARAR